MATITGKTEENFEIVEVSWHHDILVDEFAVAQRTQFETEARGEFSGARAEKGWLSPALPEDLRSTRCVNKAVRRAWIAEGVSLGDPPVRQRLASLVAGTGVSGQSAFGVVTNPSFGLSEHELFSWNEITPIEAPHSRVADWLDHLAEQFEEMSK